MYKKWRRSPPSFNKTLKPWITLSLKPHCSDCPSFTASFLETSLFTPPFLHSVPLSLKPHFSHHPSCIQYHFPWNLTFHTTLPAFSTTFLETSLFTPPFLHSVPLSLKPHFSHHPSCIQYHFPWNFTLQTTPLSTPLFSKPHSSDHPSSNASFLETPLLRSPFCQLNFCWHPTP